MALTSLIIHYFEKLFQLVVQIYPHFPKIKKVKIEKDFHKQPFIRSALNDFLFRHVLVTMVTALNTFSLNYDEDFKQKFIRTKLF